VKRLLTCPSIFHSPHPASPVILYLPSGSLIPEHEEAEERLINALAESSGSTVARINYRCSTRNPWPTPLHDVLLGYDWALENLLHSQSNLARLGVCGELLGASLATSLALTECQLGRSRIGAAAVNNPIADWVFPDDLPISEPSQLPEPAAPEETAFPADQDLMAWWTEQEKTASEPTGVKSTKRKKRTAKQPAPPAWVANSDNSILPTLTLSGERDVLFANSEHYFDRFASPIHFFRSPHGKLIYPQEDDIFASITSSPSPPPLDPYDIETQLDIKHHESYAASEQVLDVPTLVRCRAYARKYPPSTSSLDLPQWYITTGSQSPLSDQASELAKMIKRSIARQSLRSKTARVHWQDPAEKKKYEAQADLRVHLSKQAGVGLWSMPDSPGLEQQVAELGVWMKERLKA
jgi:acetyl esterase/lipase